jgi:hypothetical protein
VSKRGSVVFYRLLVSEGHLNRVGRIYIHVLPYQRGTALCGHPAFAVGRGPHGHERAVRRSRDGLRISAIFRRRQRRQVDAPKRYRRRRRFPVRHPTTPGIGTRHANYVPSERRLFRYYLYARVGKQPVF